VRNIEVLQEVGSAHIRINSAGNSGDILKAGSSKELTII
jgi:hypothetical protein